MSSRGNDTRKVAGTRKPFAGITAFAVQWSKKHWAIVITIFGYALFSLILLEVYPPPLPDEMIFYSPAHTLLQKNVLGTPVVTGMEHHTFWMPPAYFLSLAAFMRTFGLGFVNARLFSVLCGTMILLLTYRLAHQLNLGKLLTWCCLLLLVFDPSFLRLSKLIRPDSLTLLFILGSLSSHVAWVQTGERRWNALAVAAALIACISHPFGIVAPLGLTLHRLILVARKGLSFGAAIAPAIAVLAIAGVLALYASRDSTDLVAQLGAQVTRKGQRGLLASGLNWLNTYRFLPGPFLILCISVVLSFWRGLSGYLATPAGIVTIVGFLSLSGAIANFELSYSLYYLPVVLLMAGCVISARGIELRWKGTVVLLVSAAAANALLYDAYFTQKYLVELRGTTSSGEIVRQLGNSLPAHAPVLLMGTPNLYWELAAQRSDLTLLYPWAIDRRQEGEIARTVRAVVVARAFSKSYDEYIDLEVRKWQDVFAKWGRTLLMVHKVGREIPYSYRATVYEVH